ncbi:MAG: dihydrolipoyl dehydrogenase [Thermodesulfobacteriota bacterium]
MKDVIVIGGGAGGVAAAIRAGQLGAEVAVVEPGDLGGLCLNRGCIPTKFFLQAAGLYHDLGGSIQYGITVEGVHIDLAKLTARKNELVEYLRQGVSFLLKSKKVEVIRGSAVFQDPRAIIVNNEAYTARNFIIATGSRLAPPEIPGGDLEGVINSDQALALTAVPESVTVWGGSYLEVEFAVYFALLGSRVTLITPDATLLGPEDREICNLLTASLKEKGVTVIRKAEVKRVEKAGQGLVTTYSGSAGEAQVTGRLVLALRQVPNLEGLGLDKAGVTWDEEGVKVDDFQRTAAGHIYAIGDITGGPRLSHRASAQGIAAAQNIHGLETKVHSRRIPRAVFTRPEIGAVGLTEREAKQAGLDYRVGLAPYSLNARAMIQMEAEGFVKIISEPRYGEILGVHIIGPQAAELIGQAVAAMNAEATVEDLVRSISPHPSLSEALPEAAREALGRGGALYMPSR